jgi:SIR2-like domain
MKKVTVLLGAGAAIPWQAPSTARITEAIKNSTDHMVGDQTLGVWMTHLLKPEFNASQNQVTFEAYVDFMESVAIYLLGKDPHTSYSIQGNLYKLFELKDDILAGIEQLTWSNNSRFNSLADKTTESFYSLIRIISNQIRPYLNNFDEAERPLNIKLRQFCEHFMITGYSLRAYSLNYDRSIPLVFESSSSKYEIFDGFNIPNAYSTSAGAELNLLNKAKVITDKRCHSFYNLHGSLHWSFQDANYKVTRNADPYVLMATKKYKSYQEYLFEKTAIHANPNERIFPTQIITGYRKTQRTNQEPFSLFYHTFLYDIYEADVIVIIGYSFSDPHINHLLREALRTNKKVYNVNFRNISNRAKEHGIVGFEGKVLKNDYPDRNKWFRGVDQYFSEYPNGFSQFLEDEEWFNILPV